MFNDFALNVAYKEARAEARQEGIPEDEIDSIVTERLQEMASRHIAQFVDREHWQNHDNINKHMEAQNGI